MARQKSLFISCTGKEINRAFGENSSDLCYFIDNNRLAYYQKQDAKEQASSLLLLEQDFSEGVLIDDIGKVAIAVQGTLADSRINVFHLVLPEEYEELFTDRMEWFKHNTSEDAEGEKVTEFEIKIFNCDREKYEDKEYHRCFVKISKDRPANVIENISKVLDRDDFGENFMGE